MNILICCRLIGYYSDPTHDYCNFILYALTTLLYFPLLYLPLLYLPLLHVFLYAIAIRLFNRIRMRQYIAPIKISAASQLTG